MIVIRPSSLPTWQDCARRTAARSFRIMVEDAGYELRDLPTHVGAKVGTSVHAGAHYMLDEKLKSGGSLPAAPQSVEAAMAAFDEELDGQSGTLWDGTTDRRDTGQKQIERMTLSYHVEIAPLVEPIMVETRLEADIMDGVVLSGQSDVLTAIPGGIRDLKTGTGRRANAAQYGAYDLLSRSHGIDVRTIVEDFVPRVSIKKPQPPAERHEIDPVAASQEADVAIDDMQRSLRRFETYLDTGQRAPHLAFRANPMSSLCGAKWCPAHSTKFCTAHLGDE